MAKFSDVFEDVTKLGKKIPTDSYHANGLHPIIDQGQSNIAGYTDETEGLFTNVPAIVFGDHTRAIKYVDIPCFLGADGVKLLKAKIENPNYRYLFYALSAVKIPDTGYNRHFKWLKLSDIPLPNYEKQQEIVEILDKAESLLFLRKQQLTKLDELVKSRFIELFGNFVYDHNRWQICAVGDVAETIDPQPSHRTPPVSADGVPYIGIAECNYRTRLIDFEKARKVGKNVLQEHMERYTLDSGDFIIGKIGTIGKPFFVPAEQNYTLSANTVLIKPVKKRSNHSICLRFFNLNIWIA